ncbi:MAG: hypothetical protein NDI73_02165 [Desulfuromonadales bacterium]|nr:hypothetical protein [Desulfuromonadales bacterium]
MLTIFVVFPGIDAVQIAEQGLRLVFSKYQLKDMPGILQFKAANHFVEQGQRRLRMQIEGNRMPAFDPADIEQLVNDAAERFPFLISPLVMICVASPCQLALNTSILIKPREGE